MSRITPVTGIAFGVLLALIALFAFTAPRTEAASDLRVALACSPLTSSQSAQPGDEQVCRTRVRNHGQTPITGITTSRWTPNNGVTISAKKFSQVLPCDQQTYTCAPFDLAYGETVIITEVMQFDATSDNRGNTRVTATGTQAGYPISASATEQKSLP